MSDEEYLAEEDSMWTKERAHEPECGASVIDPTTSGRCVWWCTRPEGHTGLHVDCGYGKIYLRWSTDYQPLPNLLLP